MDTETTFHTWPERLLATDLLFEDPDLEVDFPSQFIVYPVHWGIVTPLKPVEYGKQRLYQCGLALDSDDDTPVDEMNSPAYVLSLLDKVLPGPRPVNVDVIRSALYRVHRLCASTLGGAGVYLLEMLLISTMSVMYS
jgi:hypothetical protein